MIDNTFINAMSNKCETENGALTNESTLNSIVDWFYHGAAMRREVNSNRIVNLFEKAFKEDKTKALRILFYIRNCRGGQGERRVFRECLKYLGNNESEWVIKNLDLIYEFGRWDDYLVLLKTKCKDSVIKYIANQLCKDLDHLDAKEYTKISLCAKWLPRENSKSAEKKEYAKILLESGKFGEAKIYRKGKTILCEALNVVETKLSKKEYKDIDYSTLPSYAMLKYSKERTLSGRKGTFYRNDEKRFKEYLVAVKEGKEINGRVAKINTNTLYPYDIVKQYLIGWGSPEGPVKETTELQWKNLPDYVPEINGLPICDTSGSMNGLPLQIAMSLSLYIAERNKSGVWKNYVIPFSSTAKFLEVKGDTLLDKLNSIYTGDCSNTNLQSVFDLILARAVNQNVKKEDMPKTLLIMSDMEFDATRFGYTNYETIREKYKKAGYDLPRLVWWNIDSRNNQTPVTVNDEDNLLLSGASPATLRIALDGNYDIIEAINKIIDQDCYKKINY